MSSWAFTSGEDADDRALVERIVRFYRASFDESHYVGMWKQIFDQRHPDTHRAFMTGTIEECAALLRNPASSNMQFGFELLNVTHLPEMRTNPDSFPKCYEAYRRWLVSAAYAIGAVRLPRERNDTTRPMPDGAPSEQLLDAIERVIGPLAFPNPVPLEFGIPSSRGVVSGKAILGIYQAWRIGQTIASGPIVEIGAGLGRTTFYAYRMGFTDYTIVDLPFTMLSSSYFLGRTLGADNICFPGEPRRGVRFMPPSHFLDGHEDYALAVNIDSMTELSKSLAEHYIQAIRRQADYFLSINHEVNSFRVGDLLSGGVRHVYPFRDGAYAEEFFRTRSTSLRSTPLRNTPLLSTQLRSTPLRRMKNLIRRLMR